MLTTTIEPTSRIEPCLLETYPAPLADLISDLVAAAENLGARLHPATARSLADLVRAMNCYYSNLIEGHDTRPRDIERALHDQLDPDLERRELQLEARAHVRVQEEIDRMRARGEYDEPAKIEHVRWLHRSFYADVSPAMLRIVHEDGDYQLVPGEFRSKPRNDVAVGRHQPSSARVLDFMIYFEQRYRLEKLGRSARIAATASAHHRFNYVHPFVDGNGRVSRLMSHGMALCAGIGAHGLWSISRGLARGLSDAGEYKRMMDEADSPGRGDLDGRGNLSLEALVQFTTWFSTSAPRRARGMLAHVQDHRQRRAVPVAVGPGTRSRSLRA
ncbi:MAG TPA: Fic family protein, partial [Polyangiales bacterium]|nr:Fic family protein [Polyangiales bacterium]